MSETLPLRPHLDWLKKASKARLAELRASRPAATLSDAQLTIARDYGFRSWRALKAEIDRRRAVVDGRLALIAADTAPIAADDPQLLRLLQAVRDGDVNIVTEVLNARPALVNAKDADGQAALHVAAEHNDARLGAVLFASGGDPDLTMGGSGHTPMSWAVTCNAGDFARALAALGAKADLFCAAGIGAVDDIRAAFDETGALRPGASKTGSSRYDATGNRLPCPPESARDQVSDALYIACRNGCSGSVRELLARDPDLGFRGYAGGTALHWACFSGNRDVVAALIAAGADTVRHDNTINASPKAFGICTAASWGFGWLVKRLLTVNPDLIHETTADGRTPADLARAAGHEELARLLERSPT